MTKLNDSFTMKHGQLKRLSEALKWRKKITLLRKWKGVVKKGIFHILLSFFMTTTNVNSYQRLQFFFLPQVLFWLTWFIGTFMAV